MDAASPPPTSRLARFTAHLPSAEMTRKAPLSALDQAVISAGNFIASVMMARLVVPEQYGIYTVGFLAVLLVRAAQDGLIIQPLNSLGAALEGDEFRRYVSETGLLQLGLAFGSAALALIVGGFLLGLPQQGAQTAGRVVAALWFSFLTWQLQEFIRRLFYTRGEVGRALTNTILSNVVRIGLIFWLGARPGFTGIDGLSAMGWGALLVFLLGILQTRAIWTLSGLRLRESWARTWRFGRWLLGGGLLNWIAVQLYPILTAGMISFEAAGAYGALQNLVAPAHVLLRASDTFLTPRIARAYARSGGKRPIRLLALTYLAVGLPVAGVLAAAVIWAEPLLRLTRGETYLPYQAGVLPFVLFYALWYSYWPLQTALKATRQSRPIFIGNALAMLCMATIGIWLISRFGVYGTILGQALNAAAISAVLWLSWITSTRNLTDK